MGRISHHLQTAAAAPIEPICRTESKIHTFSTSCVVVLRLVNSISSFNRNQYSRTRSQIFLYIVIDSPYEFVMRLSELIYYFLVPGIKFLELANIESSLWWVMRDFLISLF